MPPPSLLLIHRRRRKQATNAASAVHIYYHRRRRRCTNASAPERVANDGDGGDDDGVDRSSILAPLGRIDGEQEGQTDARKVEGRMNGRRDNMTNRAGGRKEGQYRDGQIKGGRRTDIWSNDKSTDGSCQCA